MITGNDNTNRLLIDGNDFLRPGSLEAYLAADRAARIGSLSPSAANRTLYSAADIVAQTVTRRPSNVLASANIEPLSVVVSGNSNNNPFVLISPRCAARSSTVVAPAIGYPILFATMGSQAVVRTVAAVTRNAVPGVDLIYLDSPVPAGFGIAKLLPDDWRDYTPDGGMTYFLLSSANLGVGSVRIAPGLTLFNSLSGSANPDPWYIASANSSPVFFMIGGEVVLIGFTSATVASTLVGQNAAMQSAMNAVDATQRLSLADLSGFSRRLTIRGWRDGEDFSPAVSPVDVVESSAGSTLTTIKDSVFRDDSSAKVRTDAQLAAITLDGQFAIDGPVAFVSLNPSILTVDAGGLCQFAGTVTGTATIPVNVTCRDATWQDSATRQISVTVSRVSGQTVRRLDSRVAGSLSAYLDAQVAARTALVTPTDQNRSLYSSRNWSAKTATRNLASILADMDISPMVVMNSYSRENGQGGGVLVTPQDVLLADHFTASWANGVDVMFLGKSGATYTRKIVDSRWGTGDIRLCRLDSPLPGDVSVAKVFGSDIATRLPTINKGFAIYTSGQGRRIGVRYADVGVSGDGLTNYDTNPYTGGKDPWWYPLVAGDSGSPGFVFVNNEYVVLCVWMASFYGPMPGGPSFMAKCNAALADMGGSATLTVADVSGFTAF